MDKAHKWETLMWGGLDYCFVLGLILMRMPMNFLGALSLLRFLKSHCKTSLSFSFHGDAHLVKDLKDCI